MMTVELNQKTRMEESKMKLTSWGAVGRCGGGVNRGRSAVGRCGGGVRDSWRAVGRGRGRGAVGI